MRTKLTVKNPRPASPTRAPVRSGSLVARKAVRPAGPPAAVRMHRGWSFGKKTLLALVLVTAALLVWTLGTQANSIPIEDITNESRFRSALRAAAYGDNRWVIIGVANSEAALHNLGPFLQSLREQSRVRTDLYKRAVIISLDEAAHNYCLLLHNHNPQLCVWEDNNINPESLKGGPEASLGYLKAGWTRAAYAKQAVELNYTVMMVDLDMVFFKDPFQYLESLPKEDLFATEDCASKPYDPYRKIEDQDSRMANLGLVVFPRNNRRTLEFLTRWLKLAVTKDPNEKPLWDQWAFKLALEKMIDDDREFKVTILPANLFPNFCCNYCADESNRFAGFNTYGGLQKYLAEGGEQLCPRSTRQQWYSFHFACAIWPDSDAKRLPLVKGQMAAALWQNDVNPTEDIYASNTR